MGLGVVIRFKILPKPSRARMVFVVWPSGRTGAFIPVKGGFDTAANVPLLGLGLGGDAMYRRKLKASRRFL